MLRDAWRVTRSSRRAFFFFFFFFFVCACTSTCTWAAPVDANNNNNRATAEKVTLAGQTRRQEKAPRYRETHQSDSRPAELNRAEYRGDAPGPDHEHPDKEIRKITFGSCNRQSLPQPLWADIAAEESDVFVWLGDAVYADYGYAFVRYPADLERLKASYAQQKEREEYKAFLATGVDVIGVWDDHDYGENDGDHTYTEREAARGVFLDFIDTPADSPIRGDKELRPGVYSSHSYGGAKLADGTRTKKVQVILLDVRYNQHLNASETQSRVPEILGAKQWRWLRQQLTFCDADLLLIGSGLQVVNIDKYVGESWQNFKEDRDQLFNMLLTELDRRTGVVMLSGDVHHAEIARTFACEEHLSFGRQKKSMEIRPIWDITSSSLTHSWGSMMCVTVPRSLGVPKFLIDLWANQCVHAVSSRISLFMERPHAVGPVVAVNNFGKIEIDWEKETVTVEIVFEQGPWGETPVMRHELPISYLKVNTIGEGLRNAVDGVDDAYKLARHHCDKDARFLEHGVWLNAGGCMAGATLAGLTGFAGLVLVVLFRKCCCCWRGKKKKEEKEENKKKS